MLTFEQKLSIIESFSQLQRKDVSLGRINFQFEDSVYERKNLVYHLHPNGNGYVYAGLLNDPRKDAKGLVNIRDLDAEELHTLLSQSIASLSELTDSPEALAITPKPPKKPQETEVPAELDAPDSLQQLWQDKKGNTLVLRYEDDAELWYIWALDALDCAFETEAESIEYLAEEGFRRVK
ncbi:hypothetical protein DFQ01_12926 [Paenibacillus cellulosilyticus]|uniref:Uncharacterized protein n=1 Tax=Paenibacillus cellulosilyticus TaxID=375489 RepID=A0A2V2YLW4_9BACL|nr:hypothetical protein [Paenibacillus cellulosilyticus]PWV95191.1 hypothetical protein DFQ01_12926 [Paenibacillus cellulosilyticus]QKS46055.1 hypothetical protein HUB94_17655 [Paenibacillus cellulosilyticus]